MPERVLTRIWVAALACGDALVVVHLRVPGPGHCHRRGPGAVHVDGQLCARAGRGCGREWSPPASRCVITSASSCPVMPHCQYPRGYMAKSYRQRALPGRTEVPSDGQRPLACAPWWPEQNPVSSFPRPRVRHGGNPADLPGGRARRPTRLGLVARFLPAPRVLGATLAAGSSGGSGRSHRIATRVELAQLEKRCCGFFDFSFEIAAEAVTLVVGVPAGAQSVLNDFSRLAS